MGTLIVAREASGSSSPLSSLGRRTKLFVIACAIAVVCCVGGAAAASAVSGGSQSWSLRQLSALAPATIHVVPQSAVRGYTKLSWYFVGNPRSNTVEMTVAPLCSKIVGAVITATAHSIGVSVYGTRRDSCTTCQPIDPVRSVILPQRTSQQVLTGMTRVK